MYFSTFNQQIFQYLYRVLTLKNIFVIKLENLEGLLIPAYKRDLQAAFKSNFLSLINMQGQYGWYLDFKKHIYNKIRNLERASSSPFPRKDYKSHLRAAFKLKTMYP